MIEKEVEPPAVDGSQQYHADLPAYSPTLQLPTGTQTMPSERVEYVIVLNDSDGDAYCTLKVRSRAASTKSLPILMEGESVVGSIQLNLKKADSIKAITISFKGLIVISGFDSRTFLDLSQTIWQSSMGDPYDSTQPIETPFTNKLTGNHSWPFSITLPYCTQLSEKEAKENNLAVNERLPPTLADRGWHSSINYQISVNIARSGFFQANKELKTLVGYSPATRPDPPHRLRALSYQENTPILGPDLDKEGWKVFPEVQLKGTLFKEVDASLSLSLALATPLAYTRGTSFPCALTLKSVSKQALELLACPNALNVHMRRKLKTEIGESMSGASILIHPEDFDRFPFTKANWHPAEVNELDGLYSCLMLGELSLPHDLVPSFKFGQFDCRYVVDLYPPDAAGFEPASEERLFRTDVTITSLLPSGPRPRAYLPPAYRQPSKEVHKILRMDYGL